MSRKKANSNVKLEQGVPGSFSMDFTELYDMKKAAKKGLPNYWESEDYNRRLFMMFRAEIMAMALSRFKWVNLPKTCNERYLELTLITQGIASIAFPKQKKGVFYSTQLAQSGRPNIYDDPTHWRAIGNNGFNFDADWRTGVVVWDNRMRFPLLEKINIWARELTDLVRTKQLNRQHQKIPFIFNVPQEMVQQATNIYKQVAGGEPAIIGTSGMEQFKPEIWNTEVTYIGKELNAEMENVWNEVYQCLGIANQTFKTERMIEDEVKTNREPSEMIKLDSLNCRREAVKKLNDRFADYIDEPIRVVWNYDNASDNYNFKHDLRSLVEVKDNDTNFNTYEYNGDGVKEYG